MDSNVMRALTPVSGLPSASNRSVSTAAGTVVPTAASAVEHAVDHAPKLDMEAIARQLQDFLSSSDRDIEFRVDADTGAQVVTVRDATTGDIIRQMPGEEVLRAFKNLNVKQGALLDAMI